MKKWMCICAATTLVVSTLIGRSTSAGATIAMVQIEATMTDAVRVKMEKKETIKTAEISEKVQDIASEGTTTVVGKYHVRINVKDYGTISMELYGDEAPITVANFLKPAKDGLYDGLTFRRIISGFMIQGGDSLGVDMSGSDQEIKGGFFNSGMENPLSHIKGVIFMACSQTKDNINSQFFIVYGDSIPLGGGYACFGHVTEGMEVVGAICEDIKMEDNNGSMAKGNQPVIESIGIVD